MICDQQNKSGPIKQLSIIRLELQAVKLVAELAGFCESRITTIISSKQFWKDSPVSFAWIQSKQRLKVNISNRMSKIRENSYRDHWSFILGKMNPANHGTRGLASSHETFQSRGKPQDCWIFSVNTDPHIFATKTTHLLTPIIEN